MMRNPFAINNRDLDGGNAREERQRDESSNSVKKERGDGRGDHREGTRGKRWFDVTSSEVDTYATEGTSGAAATAASCILYEQWLSFLSYCLNKKNIFCKF